MFVQKRKGGNRLVESYREGGKVHKRIVCNLGEHETPEAALEAWRADDKNSLAALLEAAVYMDFRHGIDMHHGGRVPRLADVLARARDEEYAEDFIGPYGLDLSDFIHELRDAEFARNDAEPLRKRIAVLEAALESGRAGVVPK